MEDTPLKETFTFIRELSICVSPSPYQEGRAEQLDLQKLLKMEATDLNLHNNNTPFCYALLDNLPSQLSQQSLLSLTGDSI